MYIGSLINAPRFRVEWAWKVLGLFVMFWKKGSFCTRGFVVFGGAVLLGVGLGEWWDGMVGAWRVRGTVKGVGWLVGWVGDIVGPFW